MLNLTVDYVAILTVSVLGSCNYLRQYETPFSFSFLRVRPFIHLSFPVSINTMKSKCDLGDEWEYKYPIPLSEYPNQKVKTGNDHYDAKMSELELLGYRPLQVIAKGRSGTIVLAQDLHKITDAIDERDNIGMVQQPQIIQFK
jgi:hypothetical protein